MTVTPLSSTAGRLAIRRTPLAADRSVGCSDDAPYTPEHARRVAQGLVGEEIPELEFRTGLGRTVQLARETESGAVIYIYPGVSAVSVDRDMAAFEDGGQHRAFDCEHDALRGYSLKVLGLSSEPQRAARMRVLENRVCNHELLSDPELQLARTLGLPTFTHEGASYYRRLTLVVFEGQIAKVFYPVDSPSRSAAQVICWLRVTGH
jgi:peroxiredoxin